jgi:CDP-diacylglycerol---serine O-phosphatidyltransferase
MDKKERKQATGLVAQIPNMFTLLNLFFGSLAIIYALQTESIVMYMGEDSVSSFNIPEKLNLAAICIMVAGVIDFLDGFVARLIGASSEMGKQLDSLSDVVSFGVAPAVIMYQLLRFSYAREENGMDIPIIVLLPALLIGCAAAYRLARFNLDPSQSHNFKGVPVPAIGIVVASFPLIIHFMSGAGDVRDILINKWVLYAAILIFSYLMVSTIPIMGMKFNDFTIKNNMPKVILLIITIVAALIFHWAAFPVVFIAYILLSLFYKRKLQ